MPQAETTAGLDLLECAGDAFPYTVVVPDDHPFLGDEPERRGGIRHYVIIGMRSVHEDESGESSAMSNVMLLAIGAFIVVVLFYFGEDIVKKLKEWWNTIGGQTPSDNFGGSVK